MSDSREHTRSYYAATANAATNFARLDGEDRCDVVIVGGGFTGVSAMLHLAERGYDVVLLEANRIGWGASGRNGGQLIDGFVEEDKIEKHLGAGAAKIAYEMGLECRDIVVDRIEKYSIDCDLKFGYLDLALSDRDMRDFERTVEAKIKAAYPHEVRLVRKKEMREYIGSDRYLGGLVNQGNGHLHPLNLCIGEALAAEGLGARIFERSPVIRIHNGAAPQVETATGTVRARKILLAGNAYLGTTEPKLSGAVIPAGSYVIATEPLTPRAG